MKKIIVGIALAFLVLSTHLHSVSGEGIVITKGIPTILAMARNRIAEGEELLAQSNVLLDQAQSLNLDAGHCNAVINEARELLEKAKKSLGNPIYANNLALQAIKRFHRAIECLKFLLEQSGPP